jgi:hypothetical protein
MVQAISLTTRDVISTALLKESVTWDAPNIVSMWMIFPDVLADPEPSTCFHTSLSEVAVKVIPLTVVVSVAVLAPDTVSKSNVSAQTKEVDKRPSRQKR